MKGYRVEDTVYDEVYDEVSVRYVILDGRPVPAQEITIPLDDAVRAHCGEVGTDPVRG